MEIAANRKNIYDVVEWKASSTLECIHQKTYSNRVMKESTCCWKPNGRLYTGQILTC